VAQKKKPAAKKAPAKKKLSDAELKQRAEHKQAALEDASNLVERLKHTVANLAKKIARRKAKRNQGRSAEEAIVERVIAEVKRCVDLDLPYVWGGGHDESPTHAFHPGGGGDCSSYACHLGQVAIPDLPTGTTFTMEADGKANRHGLENGPGRFITYFIKNNGGGDDHVITRIVYHGRVIWTQCGGSDNTKPRGGACIFSPSAARKAQFYYACHPKGL
jgi:hypothetical protein